MGGPEEGGALNIKDKTPACQSVNLGFLSTSERVFQTFGNRNEP